MVTTFLPYPSFEQSIQSLDDKRLGKQRVECKQILTALRKYTEEGITTGYIRHPATLMWFGYENALKYYHNLCIEEWIRRGKNNTMELLECNTSDIEYPWFIGWNLFHYSHQASLLRKDYEFYSKIFNHEEFFYNRGYVWPSHHDPLTIITFAEEHINELDEINTNGKPLFAPISSNKKNPKTPSITVKELRNIARDQGIVGYSKMKKQELMTILGITL